MRIALYAWRVNWRRSWQTAVIVAVIGGLLGAVSMASLAGARRTDSAYGRYLQSVKASDLMIDIPGPLLSLVRGVEHLPGKVSAAAWLGLNGAPIINGKVDPSFEADGIAVSLDGEYFRQDKLTVLAGKLPALNSTSQMAVTQPMAREFHLHVGSHLTWQFTKSEVNAQGFPVPGKDDNGVYEPGQRTTFDITAIAALPPALGDTFDDIHGAILPPGAASQYLASTSGGRRWVEWAFGWVAMRLPGGDAGVPAMQRQLGRLSAGLADRFGGPVTYNIRRLAIAKDNAQQAIEPQAVALAILGGLIALAMLVLVGQGLTQLLSRSAADEAVLRALGATRGEAATALAGPGGLAVAGSIVLSVAGAIALSPLAPVGEVRAYDPQRGVRIDWLVLGGGAVAMLILLGGALAWLAWRAAGQPTGRAATRPLALISTSRRSGLPVSVLTGIRYALERGHGRQRVPVRATLAGSVVAVTALAVLLVFSTSLTALVRHPVRYGWNWSTLVQSQGGWGQLPPAPMTTIMDHQTGITGWSEFGFSQLLINHKEFPVLGLQHEAGAVQPPTTSGHPLTTAHQIEIGSTTMRQLGLHTGEEVTVGTAKAPAVETMKVVGVVTLPSMGTVLTDHVSLGRGAMVEESALLKVQGLPPYTEQTFQNVTTLADALSSPSFPSAVAIAATSSTAASRAVAAILKAEPDQTAGGMYPLAPQQGAQVVDLQQIGALPISIALGVALAAVLVLALTIIASVRQRRRELALLKSLGMRRSQLRAVVVSQASTILVVAIVIGIPLGIVAGRWAWTGFANAIGVVPAPFVPAAALALGVLAILTAGNLLASWPASMAARTPAGRVLRSQ